MNTNSVSIVIPTYNRASYLDKCILSCLNQTVSCQVIVCDHGSSDDTPVVVKKYLDKIQYVRRDIDSGIHFCWLDGILHAQHELVHINFDDDWIEPNFIEKCLNLFSDEVSCVISNARIYNEVDQKLSPLNFNLGPETGIYSISALIKTNLSDLTSPCAGIFRKTHLIDSLYVNNIPFTKCHYRGVGPDILFSLMHSGKYKKVGFVKEPLVYFRSHENSITIDAQNDSLKKRNINNAYDDARAFYILSRLVSKFRIFSIAKLILSIYKKSHSRIKNCILYLLD
jgi:glycosyltransferase involved in cell wall biosynthesis